MLMFIKYFLIIYTNANWEKQKYDIELKEDSRSKHRTIMDDPLLLLLHPSSRRME